MHDHGNCQRCDDLEARELGARSYEVLRAGEETERQLAEARRERDEARENADFLRKSVGECHLMISRDSPEFQMDKEWASTDLPPRLSRIMHNAALTRSEEERATAECSRAYKRIATLEADLAALRGALEDIKRQIWGGHYEWQVVSEIVLAALAASPGAAWLTTVREVVEALERVLDVHTIVYVGPEAKAAVALAEQQARALLARPEVQRWAGR